MERSTEEDLRRFTQPWALPPELERGITEEGRGRKDMTGTVSARTYPPSGTEGPRTRDGKPRPGAGRYAPVRG
jgi:hypothetical protein